MACVEEGDEEVGPVDVLVNNAGITRDMTFKKMDKANWDAVMKTNLDSVFNMTKQVCDGMVERGWGRIINISSVNGQKGAFGQTNYSAAKAGMHGFTKALALEVARKGVTVNTISPGYIGTKMVMAIPKEVLDSKIIPQIPMGRLGKPEEVAGLVAYLSSGGSRLRHRRQHRDQRRPAHVLTCHARTQEMARRDASPVLLPYLLSARSIDDAVRIRPALIALGIRAAAALPGAMGHWSPSARSAGSSRCPSSRQHAGGPATTPQR